jgi:hypothetical protein
VAAVLSVYGGALVSAYGVWPRWRGTEGEDGCAWVTVGDCAPQAAPIPRSQPETAWREGKHRTRGCVVVPRACALLRRGLGGGRWLRGRRRAKLRPWSARTMQRRCNECRAAPWKVSFPRWWVRVPAHRRPRRLADGMEGQLATHTADWNALFPPLAACRGAAKPKEEGGLPDCYLQVKRRK